MTARLLRLLVTLSVMLILAAVVYWNMGASKKFFSEDPLVSSFSEAVAVSKNPDESFDTLRDVVEAGGNASTGEAAIAWLDGCARGAGVTASDQKEFLLTMLENGGNASWTSGFRQHLFNSTFNALRRGGVGAPLHRILVKMAVSNPDKTLRLYALQHIGLERGAGQLQGPLIEEIHSALTKLTQESEGEGEVAGLAVALLLDWNGKGNASRADKEMVEVALAIAADQSRSLDNRVSAIHAAGSASLPLAREMAGDGAQPVFVRKAAIARIGLHGDASDFTTLKKWCNESSRLAQAAEPALKAIRDRIDHPTRPQPIPF